MPDRSPLMAKTSPQARMQRRRDRFVVGYLARHGTMFCLETHTPYVNCGQPMTLVQAERYLGAMPSPGAAIFELVPVTRDVADVEAVLAALPLPEEPQGLREAVEAFLAKWPAVEKRVNGMFGLQFARSSVQYDGPTIGVEIEAMRTALKGSAGGQEQEH